MNWKFSFTQQHDFCINIRDYKVGTGNSYLVLYYRTKIKI